MWFPDTPGPDTCFFFDGITYLFGWPTDCVPASSDFAELNSSLDEVSAKTT